MQAWEHWNNRTILEIIDPSMVDTCSKCEVLRWIHIGLLCAQEFPADRPLMSSFLLMYDSSVLLPPPLQPAYYSPTNMADSNVTIKQFYLNLNDRLACNSEQASLNEDSISEIEPR